MPTRKPASTLEVLDHQGGNKSRAAEILGIDRKTLREKRRRWDL